MFKSIILCSAILLGLLYPAHDAQAQVRCPAGYGGCTSQNVWPELQQRFGSGARNVLRNPNEYGRVREIGNTLENCWNCAFEAIRDNTSGYSRSRVGGQAPRRSGRAAR